MSTYSSWFCDICLREFDCWLNYHAHLHGWCHMLAVENRNEQIIQLFDVAEKVLHTLGTWERCFSCGAAKTFTVVQVSCARCTGRGGKPPSAQGVPGVPFEGGHPRFLCRTHALDIYCRSCATPLGYESDYCLKTLIHCSLLPDFHACR